MNTTIFLMLLTGFSVLSSLVTEGIKKIVKDKDNLPCNLIALIVALVIGSVGTAIYYQLNGIVFDTNNFIYMLLMGFASGLVSMVGFDKVKQAYLQIVGMKDE